MQELLCTDDDGRRRAIRSLHDQLLLRYSEPVCGTTRAVFFTETGHVVKIPLYFSADAGLAGIFANIAESEASAAATCVLAVIDRVPVIVMELVTCDDATDHMGWTRDGRYVMYDAGDALQVHSDV